MATSTKQVAKRMKEQRRAAKRKMVAIAQLTGSPGVGPNPFPDKMRVTLTYAYISSATSASGNAQYDIAFSPYDPNADVGGAQPVGFDQWMALYRNFAVLNGHIKARSAPDVIGKSSYLIGFPSISLSAPASVVAYFGQKGMVWDQLAPGAPAAKVVTSLNLPKFWGRTEAQYLADNTFWGTSSAHPTNVTYFQLHMLNFDASSFIVSTAVQIDLDVVFFTRNMVELS